MLPTPPELDEVSVFSRERGTVLDRLLSPFDSGLFRLAGLLLLTPALYASLTPSSFAIFAACHAVAALVLWLPSTTEDEVALRIAAARKVGDSQGLQAIIDAGFVVQLLSALVLTALGTALVRVATPEGSGAMAAQIRVYAGFTCVRAIVWCITGSVRGAVAGLLPQRRLSALRGLQAISEVSVTLAVLSQHRGLLDLGLAEVAVAVLGLVAAITAVQTAGLSLFPRISSLSLRTVRQIALGPLVSARPRQAMLLLAEAAVVGAVVGLPWTEASFFAALMQVCRMSVAASALGSDLWTPPWPWLVPQQNRDMQRWALRRHADGVLWPTLLVAVLLAAVGGPLLEQWLVGLTHRPIWPHLLCFWPPLAAVLCFAGPTLAQQKPVRVLVLWPLAVLATALSVTLASSALGVVGAAWATVLTLLLAAVVFGWQACSNMNEPPIAFWWSRAWRGALVALPAIATGGIFWAVRTVRSPRDLVLQLGIISILFCVPAFAAWALLDPQPGPGSR